MAVGQELVWLLSYTAAGSEAASVALDLGGFGSRERAVVSRITFEPSASDAGDPEEAASRRRPCAAVLVVEEDGFGSRRYRDWVMFCINRVTRVDDFRLFVFFYKTTVEDLDRLGSSEPSAATLRDTVQFPCDDADLKAAVTSYLEHLDDIRNASLRRRVRNVASTAARSLAIGIQISGVLVIVAGWIGLYGLKPPTPVALAPEEAAAIAVVLGIMTFPLGLYLSAGLARSSRLRASTVVFMSAVFALAAMSAVLVQAVDEYSWLLVGVVAGALIDTARRMGSRARAASRAIDLTAVTPMERPLRASLVAALNTEDHLQLDAPVVSPRHARVFISYTRASPRSAQWAQQLYAGLGDAKVECYLDRFSIREGACWRTTLNRMIGESNVFIGVMEQQSVTRLWPAAELEAALEGARTTGQPEIILLTDAALAADHPRLPVFDAVLRHQVPESHPRVMTLKETTIPVLARRLRAGRWHLPQTLLPPSLATPIGMVAALPIMVLSMVGTWGTLVAWIAAATAVLHAIGVASPVAFMATHGALPAGFLLCGFWAGFVTRLTVSTRFDVRLPRVGVAPAGSAAMARKMARVHGLMAAVFVIVMVQMFPMVAPLIVAWGVVSAAIGWASGNAFIFVAFVQKPELERRGA